MRRIEGVLVIVDQVKSRAHLDGPHEMSAGIATAIIRGTLSLMEILMLVQRAEKFRDR
jgi:hypothetical protein